jgi:L-arabinose isomerase
VSGILAEEQVLDRTSNEGVILAEERVLAGTSDKGIGFAGERGWRRGYLMRFLKGMVMDCNTYSQLTVLMYWLFTT